MNGEASTKFWKIYLPPFVTFSESRPLSALIRQVPPGTLVHLPCFLDAGATVKPGQPEASGIVREIQKDAIAWIHKSSQNCGRFTATTQLSMDLPCLNKYEDSQEVAFIGQLSPMCRADRDKYLIWKTFYDSNPWVL
jgi:hypothetical protein